MLKGQTQHRILSAPAGAYVAGSSAAYSRSPLSVVRFEAILGYVPSADPREEWHVMLPSDGLPSLGDTATGAVELMLRFPIEEAAPVASAEPERAWFCPGLNVATHRTATGAPERVWRAKTK